MGGRTARPHAAIVEEEAAVVAAIAHTLQAKGWPCVLPRLPRLGRSNVAPCWLGELGQSVIDAVVASMDATRRRQLSRPGAKDIKDYHCKPASEEGALELIDSLAGGSSRLRNFDRQPYFLSLAQRHGIDDIPMVRILRSHGLPDDGSEGVPDGTSVPKPPLSEPQTQTRAGEAAADASRQCEEAVLGAAALLTSCSVERPEAVERLGASLSPDVMALLMRGHASANPSMEPLATRLSPEQCAQLAPPPPPPSPPPPVATIETQTDAPTPAVDARRAIDGLDECELHEALDQIGERLLGPSKRNAKCLSRCVITMKRIDAYRDDQGHKQGNFLRSLLEAYGADEGERLPFGEFLPWHMYYAMRIGDDAHWGTSMSGLKFDEDGGFYIEAWRDIKFIGGNAVVQFLRGPLFSNMVKRGLIKRGHYHLDRLSLEERGERIFLGGAVPCVRSLNGRPTDEEKVTCGGMSAPLGRAVEVMAGAWSKRVSALTEQKLPPLTPSVIKHKLAAAQVKRFDPKAMRTAQQGDRAVQLCVPKKPAKGWGDAHKDRWYAQPLPTTEDAENAPPNAPAAAPAVGAATATITTAAPLGIAAETAARPCAPPTAAAAGEAPPNEAGRQQGTLAAATNNGATNVAPTPIAIAAETATPPPAPVAAVAAATHDDPVADLQALLADSAARRARIDAIQNAPQRDTIAVLTAANTEAAQYAKDVEAMERPVGFITDQEYTKQRVARWQRMDTFEQHERNQDVARRIRNVVAGKPEECAV